MHIVHNPKELKERIKLLRNAGQTFGFVPTMGYLHEGHLSLIRAARQDCDYVVVSIFVNPLQFAPGEDFNQYPKDLNRDLHLCEKEGVDFVFAPQQNQLYPQDFQTSVSVEDLSKGLCGRSRPGHFKGVATVVMKLFNIVVPDSAYFGLKDIQQLRVIQKMVEDMNMDIVIRPMPIVREADGLAMSSRNTYLTAEQRQQAVVLFKSLCWVQESITDGVFDVARLIVGMKDIVLRSPSAEIDYIEIISWETLEPVEQIAGRVIIAVAVWFGQTRLIDNIVVDV